MDVCLNEFGKYPIIFHGILSVPRNIVMNLNDVVSQYHCFQYYLGSSTMQEPPYTCKVAPISIWFQMVLIQIISWLYKDYFHHEMPIKYQYLTVITILISTSTFFSTQINVHSWYRLHSLIQWSNNRFLGTLMVQVLFWTIQGSCKNVNLGIERANTC